MNWEAIGAVGELLGALVVVITLIFLVRQVRQNTNALNTATIFNVTHEANQINATIAGNPDVARLFLLAQNDPDELTHEEQVRAQSLIRTIVNLASAGDQARSLGSLPEEYYNVLRDSAGDVAMTPGGRRFLKQNNRYFHGEFVDHIAPEGVSVTFGGWGWDREEGAR
jgi:hypothetical protein